MIEVTEAPYYTTRRTLQGRWAVVHMIPGVGVPSIDVECRTEDAALRLASDMNQQRECGWQISATFESQPGAAR